MLTVWGDKIFAIIRLLHTREYARYKAKRKANMPKKFIYVLMLKFSEY